MSEYSEGFAVPKPIKRQKSQARPKPRSARTDRVDDQLRMSVLMRDGMCFVRRYNAFHVCKNKYGHIHPPDDIAQLTIDHVWLDGARKGDRAPSDMVHLVAMCFVANIVGPSREVRDAERAYLRSLYPEARD